MSLFRPLWFTWKGKDGYGDDGRYLEIKIFYCLSTKKYRENGKSSGKTQGKHREFGSTLRLIEMGYIEFYEGVHTAVRQYK